MKPEFLTQLHVNVLSDDVSELDADFQYASAVLNQVITVPKGFHTDFASVPRFPGAYLLAGGKAKWEAVVHDYLCVHPEICSRQKADEVFHEAMGVRADFRDPTGAGQVKESQATWRRGLMYVGVRIGAAESAVKHWLAADDQQTKGSP
jgi:hypothetical protein